MAIGKIHGRIKQYLHKFWKSSLLIAAIGIFFLTPLRNLLDRDFLSAYLQGLGMWTVPLYIATYILVTVLGLPITIHTLTGGAIFGLVWGTIWSILAATVGAVGAFWLTRSLFQDWAIAKFSSHKLLQKMNRAFDRNPVNLVLMLRFAPIAPFNLVNFLLALTPIDLHTYTLATAIGIIPGTIAYTWLGFSGKTALQQGDWLEFSLASAFLVLLSLTPLWFDRSRS
jgi:uncharacterized membrane protein YdjX (TVP38/TMEM64 family)